MDENQKLLNELTERIKSELKEYATSKDLEIAFKKAAEEMKAEFGAVKEVQKKLDEIEKAAIAQGEALKSIQNREPERPVRIKDLLIKNLTPEVIEKIRRGSVEKTTILPSGITSDFGGQPIPGVGQMPIRSNPILNIWAPGTIGPNSHRTIRYMDQTTATSAAAARSVGGAAAESTLAWTCYSATIEAISHFIPVAKEMLDDYDFVESEINNFLMKYLWQKVEYYLINGTGSTPQIPGLLGATKYTAFASSTFSGLYDGSSVINLIMAMAAQVKHDTPYMPNYVLMNDYDASALQLEKDDLGQFRFPNFLSSDGMNIGGMRIIPSSLITTNTMFVGDFNWGVFYKKNPTIEIGLNTTDFVERQVSILANIDCLLLIKALNTGAFIYSSNVSDDMATIKKVSA